MSDSSYPERALRLAYERVCNSYEAITEFRAKLLALLPLATGTGAFFLLDRTQRSGIQEFLGPIGIFGFIVTLGLFSYELRGMQRCHRLEVQACLLEERFGLSKEEGMFKGQPRRSLCDMLGPPAAGLIIYITTGFTWLFLAALGFYSWSSPSRASGQSVRRSTLILLPVYIVVPVVTCYLAVLVIAWVLTHRWLRRGATGDQTRNGCLDL